MNSPASIQINNNGALQDYFTVSDIIEFGENANGNYIKFSNGLAIVYAQSSVALGYTYSKLTGIWTYPIEFITRPLIVPFVEIYKTTGLDSRNTQIFIYSGSIAQTSGINALICVYTANVRLENGLSHQCAIGYWK